MKTHQVWMLALSSLVALSGAQAVAQNPRQMPPMPGMAPIAAASHYSGQYPTGQFPVSQAYFTGAPAGTGSGVALASFDGGCAGGCDDTCAGGCDDGCAGGCTSACSGCDSCVSAGLSCISRMKGMLGNFKLGDDCDDGCGGGGCGSGQCLGGGCGDGIHGYGGYGSQHFLPNGPFGDGGCCAPRWYDVHAEWMYWTREDAGDRVNLTSLGVGGDPIVLSTDDLDLDEANGFRVTWAYLVGPGTNIEATYFGSFHWAAGAQAENGNSNLFSVFSDYGTDPGPPQFGFPQTDQAFLHRIDYASDLNNAEINLRHRWVSANCLLHGSWLFGARYVALEEELTYRTRTNVSRLNYEVSTENDLIGGQLGADMFLSISPRFKIGAEGKAGVYGNRVKQRTVSDDPSGLILFEEERDGDVAFVGEAGAIGIFRVTPRFSIRGGYQLMYLDGLALATENFNTASPFAARDAVLVDDGNAFYHGATLGFEWTW